MKVIAVIPARYASTRFPAKLMQDLNGKSLIRRTYEAAKKTNLFDEVIVATDSDLIAKEVEKSSGQVFMSLKNHESGSDRIAEAIKNTEVDIILNVQGDEPFIDKASLEKLIQVFIEDEQKEIAVGSLMTPIINKEDIENPNIVKVITDLNSLALYFSRAAIPFNRDKDSEYQYMRHLGIYAYRKKALIEFSSLPNTPLEKLEKLEQLRYLECGKKIKMIQTNIIGLGIDTPEDLEKARKIWINE